MSFWKNKKVLVTGADGFIGSHLVEYLYAQGAQVRAFVYYNSFNTWGWIDSFDQKTKDDIEIFSGDIRDPNGVYESLKGMDTVFHLAALIGIPFSYHSPDSYVDTNIKGTLNVLQAAMKHKVSKVICTSTSEVYGTAQTVPISEEHPINPQSPYAATKSAADQLAISFYRSFDLPVTILRPFNTFGSRQSARAIIPTIIAHILNGQSSIKLGNIESTRDFNFVGNTVESFCCLAESKEGLGEVFNSGSGTEISIRDLFSKICKMCDSNAVIEEDTQRFRPEKSEVARLVCDATRFEHQMGWKPKIDLDEGLIQTIAWMKKNMKYFKPEMYNV